MFERLLIVAALTAFAVLFYTLYTRAQIKRVSALEADPILTGLRPGVPAIVYFTTPGCIPCRTQQQPALMSLSEVLGEHNIQIVKIDATKDPDSATRWGVMTAPTTFVLDAHGKTRAVNYGVADVHKLQKQLGTT